MQNRTNGITGRKLTGRAAYEREKLNTAGLSGNGVRAADTALGRREKLSPVKAGNGAYAASAGAASADTSGNGVKADDAALGRRGKLGSSGTAGNGFGALDNGAKSADADLGRRGKLGSSGNGFGVLSNGADTADTALGRRERLNSAGTAGGGSDTASAGVSGNGVRAADTALGRRERLNSAGLSGGGSDTAGAVAASAVSTGAGTAGAVLTHNITVKKPVKKRVSQRRCSPVKIIPLGGLNEIGKNLYVFECSNDMFIVDCGLAFPDEDMLGVDIVIPDFSYLEKNRERFRGVVLTHGHEDHIGALPYLLKNINVPVYGTRLTLGLVEGKLKEHGILNQCSLNVVQPRQTVKMGCMGVEFIKVNHSIPDACALAIHTPAGIIVHTGDFKVDYTPIGDEGIIDLARFGELGNKGVLALLSESTNAERPGYTTSERKVGESFRNIFNSAEDRRIIVATFSSNIHRVQQIIDNAEATGRYVAVSGRSMLNVMQKAVELNYIRISSKTLIDIDAVNSYPPEKIVIVTTGSQGEPLSALSRMSTNDHRQVKINPRDLIVISATPIPGNEKLVGRVVNELMRSGAEVVYEAMYEVHVSGHACQDELKMMMSLTKPRFFIPVHGEYKHLQKHAQLARKMGIEDEDIFILGLGNVLETDSVDMKVTGQVNAGAVLVDGLGVGDVGAVVLRDRKRLAEDGLMIIVSSIERESGTVLSGPDIVSRGFVYVRESEGLMDEARVLMRRVLDKCAANNTREWGMIKNAMKDELSDLIYEKTKRNPMILPILMMID